MERYHKIDTLFRRDMEGNKKLIEGEFRNPTMEYLKDNEWTFTEKVDGMNMRIHWDGHKVTFAGRSKNAHLPGDLVERLTELFQGNINEEIFEEKFGENPVTFYGEGYGAGIQKGGNYSDTKEFILFDVMVGDMFLERENVEEIAKAFNIDVVPVFPFKTLQEAIDHVKTRPFSPVGKGLIESEGVVGVPKVRLTDFRGNRVIVKVKTCDFV